MSYSDDWKKVTQTTNEYDHSIVNLMDTTGRVIEEKQVLNASSVTPSEFAFIRG